MAESGLCADVSYQEKALSPTVAPPPIATSNESKVSLGSSGGLREESSARALAASGLQKSYGRRRVVDDVTLHVEPGEVGGLLGANGAGKTTTFYMIVGLETP